MSPTDTTPRPYPLVLRPILMEKVWGGDRLARLGKTVRAGQRVGESWELADLGATSASGGGGSAARSVIENGALAGKTIHEALELWHGDLLGAARATTSGEVPLLIKFLDARENLSVQVHPSPAYAANNAGANLKTECWVILDAEPGAVIYKGIRPGVGPGEFRRHIENGNVVNDLISVPAIVGECHNLPSGTCHALGAGVLVAEVQTPSDTTFRVFDWGRTGRELHIEQAMACIDFAEAPPATALAAGRSRGLLVKTEYFEVERLRGREVIEAGHGFSAWTVLDGGGAVVCGENRVEISRGTTLVMPSACSPGCRIEPGPSGIDALRAGIC